MPRTSTEAAPRIAILTVSDRSYRGESPDAAGPAVAGLVEAQGWQVSFTEILPDDLTAVAQILGQWCDSGAYDVVLTTGGTGFSSRDVTPEATRSVIEREAPGLSEAMRLASRQSTPHAMLSRATAGIRKATLVVNLPGSPQAAIENLQVILPVIPHAVQLLRESPGAQAGHSFDRAA